MKRKEKAGMKSFMVSPQPLSPRTYGSTHLLPPYKEAFFFFFALSKMRNSYISKSFLGFQHLQLDFLISLDTFIIFSIDTEPYKPRNTPPHPPTHPQLYHK